MNNLLGLLQQITVHSQLSCSQISDSVLNLYTFFWTFGLDAHHVSPLGFLQSNLVLSSVFLYDLSILFPSPPHLPSTPIMILNEIFSAEIVATEPHWRWWFRLVPQWLFYFVWYYSWAYRTTVFCLKLSYRQTSVSYALPVGKLRDLLDQCKSEPVVLSVIRLHLGYIKAD